MFVSMVGFSVSKHYCNNQFISYSINAPDSSCCEDCNNDCCHNEDQLIVLKVDFSIPVTAVTNIGKVILFANKQIETTSDLIEGHGNNDIEINLKPPLGIHVFLAKIQSYLL